MFIQKDLNLQQRWWLEISKYYNMSILFHPVKAIMVVDALSWMFMVSVTHIQSEKKLLICDVQRFAQLGVQFVDSPKNG